MKITTQALLDRGFVEDDWTYNGIVYEKYYHLSIVGGYLEFWGENLDTVDITVEDCTIPIPNCRNLKQLDALIDLFREKAPS